MAGEYVRLTGLFKTKNPKCFSGTIQDDSLQTLKQGIKDAESSGQALVLYCFLNGQSSNPKFSKAPPVALSYKLGEPAQQRTGGSRPQQRSQQQRSTYQPYKKKEPAIPMEEPVFDDFGDDPGFSVTDF